MIGVSNAWKAIHKESILPESFVELTYWITEPGVQLLAMESNNGAAFFSDHEAIVDTTDRAFRKYATLENNIWSLDGSVEILPTAAPYGDTGYVSDGNDFPTVTIKLPSVRTQPIPGITIVFSETYGEYATRVRLTALNGTRIIAEQEFSNDSARTTFDFPISGYDTIHIDIAEWIVPDHRARIERVYLGAIEVYTDASLVSYSHTQSVDILSTALPKNEIKFSLDNSSDMWNPDNPIANVRYLMDRQEVSVRYGYKLPTGVEWIKAGTFWINSWDTPSNGLEATFTARDLLEFMDVTYTGPRSGTLYSIAQTALQQSNLPVASSGNSLYYIDESLKSVSTDFSEDENVYTTAVILQMVANAGQCVIRLTRDGELRVERLDRHLSDYTVDQNVSYSHPERSMTKPPKDITVNDGLWVESISTVGESITINNPVITSVENAGHVGKWAAAVLSCRNILRGEYRPDPRLDALDVISVESKYSNNFIAAVTDIEYTYNGAFRGTYTCREVEV